MTLAGLGGSSRRPARYRTVSRAIARMGAAMRSQMRPSWLIATIAGISRPGWTSSTPRAGLEEHRRSADGNDVDDGCRRGRDRTRDRQDQDDREEPEVEPELRD